MYVARNRRKRAVLVGVAVAVVTIIISFVCLSFVLPLSELDVRYQPPVWEWVLYENLLFLALALVVVDLGYHVYKWLLS